MGGSLTPLPALRQQANRLLAAARSDPAGAGVELLTLYRPYLLAIANQEIDPALRAKAGPSDLVQESLLIASERLPNQLNQTEADFRAWLRGLLIRRLDALRQQYCRTAKRQIRRERSLHDVEVRDFLKHFVTDVNATPGSCAARNEKRERIQEALRRLPVGYRQVILWHHQDGLGWTQIATKLDRSPDAVRMLWKRAIQTLTEVLREFPDIL